MAAEEFKLISEQRNRMPDTGEDREIKSRVNAREAELISESKKLRQKSKAAQERFDAAQKKRVQKIDAPIKDVPKT